MDLTIQDAGDLTIWIGAICAALVAIAAALHQFIVKPLKGFISGEIRKVTGPLETQDNKTVAQVVEGSAHTLESIASELATTNKLALQNQVELLSLGRRLDEHLLHHHEENHR